MWPDCIFPLCWTLAHLYTYLGITLKICLFKQVVQRGWDFVPKSCWIRSGCYTETGNSLWIVTDFVWGVSCVGSWALVCSHLMLCFLYGLLFYRTSCLESNEIAALL